MADIFNQMLAHYEMRTKDEKLNAMHEVMQQITLAGLYRGGFFNNAAFYGGTCLRIFHGLPRFSEDMDFSLLQKNETFSLQNYFEFIIAEFDAVGRKIEINRKNKKIDTKVESAFLKDTTEIYNVRFQTEKNVKIKIEVDTDPPLQFVTEDRLLLQPFSFMTRCFSLPALFAGKMHALLFRKWRGRVKGRDWYDFEWYVRNNVPLDFTHFVERAAQSEGTTFIELTRESFIDLIKEKINQTKIEAVKADVRPFIKNPQEMEIWSTDYFLQLVGFLKFK